MMRIQTLPCGCRHQGPMWVELCPGHADSSFLKRQAVAVMAREGAVHQADFGQLEARVLAHYTAHPEELPAPARAALAAAQAEAAPAAPTTPPDNSDLL